MTPRKQYNYDRKITESARHMEPLTNINKYICHQYLNIFSNATKKYWLKGGTKKIKLGRPGRQIMLVSLWSVNDFNMINT